MTRTRSLAAQLALAFTALVFCMAVPRAAVAQILWTDWLTAPTGTASVATGTITTSGGPVAVTYTGQILDFSQTSCGINYWGGGAPYLSATVTNAPTPCEIISISGGPNALNHTVAFSQPILNPVMAILSLGQPSFLVTYEFNSPFNVLSFGPGFYGSPGTLSQLTPNVLTGNEGHGVIQFQGAFSSISWTVPTFEHWHGFTLGVVGLAPPPTSSVPEPATVVLMLAGLASIGAALRVRARRQG
jgi:hypothetical protein